MKLRITKALVGSPRRGQRLRLRTKRDEFTFVYDPHPNSDFTWRLEQQGKKRLRSLFPGLEAASKITFDTGEYTVYIMNPRVCVGERLTLIAAPRQVGLLLRLQSLSNRGSVTGIKILN